MRQARMVREELEVKQYREKNKYIMPIRSDRRKQDG